jgi:glycosyltransferase involved in cell wall biosynthesis
MADNQAHVDPGHELRPVPVSDVLVLDFVGTDGVARALVEELVTADGAEFARTTAVLDDVLKRRRIAARDHLVVVGAPPEDGIGYGLVPFVALALRARTVTLIDARSRSVASGSLGRYLARAAPLTAAQLLGSGLAVAAQGVVARPKILGAAAGRPLGGRLSRLLYLFPSVGTGLSVGGAVSHAHGMLRALDRLGIDVDPVTSHPGIAETATAQSDLPFRWRVVPPPRSTKAVPASTAFGLDLAVIAATRKAARPCDLVYQRHTRFSLAGALAARAVRVPFFLEFNSPAEFFHTRATVLSRRRRRCEDALLLAATRVFVVSTTAKALVIERGVPEERVIVNPNGVDLERFDPSSRGGSLRAELGFSADDVVFGFVGSFMSFHGVPKLAEAFVEVAREHPQAKLLLVGDGDERPRVAQILGDLVGEGRVRMTGRVAPAEIPSYLAASDVLVSPHVPLEHDTPFFGSPTKLFEYMAAGRPIAASRLGQIAEILEHERTALLAEPGDARDLATALKRLAEDASLRDRLGRAARSEGERYSWTAHAQRVVDEFYSLPEDPALHARSSG